MTDLITDAEHREAIRLLVEALGKHDLKVMALGSTALLLRTGRLGTTKDVDIHAFPLEDAERSFDTLEVIARDLGGHQKLSPDGATTTLWIPVRGLMVPVGLIEGGSEFITPEVLRDAIKTATVIAGAYVPSWEHFIAMKAEAHFDRTGEAQRKYLADLTLIRDRLPIGSRLDAKELERVIRLRPSRKHADMLATAFRIFARNL